MITSKTFACSLAAQLSEFTLRGGLTAGGLKLCVGAMPTDAELETLVQSSTRITNNVAVSYNMVGVTYTVRDVYWPPEILMATPPTTYTVNSTLAGTIGWCVFWNGVDKNVFIADVTDSTGNGVVRVSTINVAVGTPVTLESISIQTGVR
jgi:hypothetical protein